MERVFKKSLCNHTFAAINKRKLPLKTGEHIRGLDTSFAGQVLAAKYRGPAVTGDMQMVVGKL